jgi:hypothetical protein
MRVRKTGKTLIAIAAMVALYGIASAITGQARGHPFKQVCGTTEQVENLLRNDYGEVPVSRGLSVNGQKMTQLFVAPDGSWSIISTQVRGQTCIIEGGESWIDDAAPPAPLGKPS